MSRHDWLLLIHVAGAFSVLAGALLAVVLNQAATRRSRPSEVALLPGLTRVAVVLIALVLGSVGGRRDRHTRELAEQLAASGDQPSAELAARLRDPVSLTLSYGSGAAVLAILVLMIWKPA